MRRTALALLAFALAGSGCGYYLRDRDAHFAVLRRASYVRRHPELSADRKELIADGSIEAGMSEAEVAASWGRHYEKDRFAKDGVRGSVWKVWPDPPIEPGHCYFLTFVNGRLQSWYEVRH